MYPFVNSNSFYKILSEGAEAKILLANIFGKEYVVKQRIPKTYRVKELDLQILKKRTKREANILHIAKNVVNCPYVFYSDNRTIIMEYLDYPEAKSVVEKQPDILKKIALNVSKLHEKNIIHGDLTLSNILFDTHNGDPYFIDFGLAFVSAKNEDKAMDLEVMREIIIADFSENYWQLFEEEYEKYNPTVIKHMRKIQMRKKYLTK